MLISQPDHRWIDNGIQVKSTLSQTLSNMGTRKYNKVHLNDSILSKFPHDSLWQNAVALVFSHCPCCSFKAGKNCDGYFSSDDLIQWLHKLTLPSIFLKDELKGLPQVYFFLTMHRVIRNAPWMPFQHVKCPRTLTRHGTNTKMAGKCGQQHSNGLTQMKQLLKTFISREPPYDARVV